VLRFGHQFKSAVFCSASKKRRRHSQAVFTEASGLLAIYFEDKQESCAAPNFLWRLCTQDRERAAAGYLWRVHATRANKYQGGDGGGGCDKKLHLAPSARVAGKRAISFLSQSLSATALVSAGAAPRENKDECQGLENGRRQVSSLICFTVITIKVFLLFPSSSSSAATALAAARERESLSLSLSCRSHFCLASRVISFWE
jgi:hypothetical protein